MRRYALRLVRAGGALIAQFSILLPQGVGAEVEEKCLQNRDTWEGKSFGDRVSGTAQEPLAISSFYATLLSGQRFSIFHCLLRCLLGRARPAKKKTTQVRGDVFTGGRGCL